MGGSVMSISFIQAEYRLSSGWNLEDLGIDPVLIESYFIKYDTLHITFKDGTEEEFEASYSDSNYFDYKRPYIVHEE